MKLQLKLLNLWRFFFLPELHNDLHEMPVVLWWKIQKSNNALELIKGVKTASKKITSHVNNQWYKLNNDFTDYFGVQKAQKRYFKLIAEHQIYVSAFARTKSHRWTTKRLIVEEQLKAYKPKEVKDFNPYNELRDVSMALDGATIDPKTTSVLQYYSDRESAVTRNGKAKKNQNKR